MAKSKIAGFWDGLYLELEVRRVDCRSCGKVKRERLAWLADNPFYTKRFAFFVGRRCRVATIKDVAEELHLDWHSVKEYMREQLRRVGTPGPKVFGVDEISIRKGHSYRIVVSDLLGRRPIWFGGTDRSQDSMELFFKELGIKKCRGIYLAVMDMWKPFHNATLKHVPDASIAEAQIFNGICPKSPEELKERMKEKRFVRSYPENIPPSPPAL